MAQGSFNGITGRLGVSDGPQMRGHDALHGGNQWLDNTAVAGSVAGDKAIKQHISSGVGGGVMSRAELMSENYCDACKKRFGNGNTYKHHLTGKRHIKALQVRRRWWWSWWWWCC